VASASGRLRWVDPHKSGGTPPWHPHFAQRIRRDTFDDIGRIAERLYLDCFPPAAGAPTSGTSTDHFMIALSAQVDISYVHHQSSSSFLISAGCSVPFPRDPCTNVRWAMYQFDASCFTSHQQLHDVEIDKCSFLEIQCDALRDTLYLL